MKLTLQGNKLCIDLYGLMGELSKEQRAEIIDNLAIQTEVIDEVMNQVLDGWTTLGSHGARGMGGDPRCTHGIEGARLRIAEMAGEVAQSEIAAMKLVIERERKRADEAWASYRDRQHSRDYA